MDDALKSDALNSEALNSEKNWLADTRASYDTVAADYAELVRGLLDRTPYERAMLGLFADSVRVSGSGPVADLGCGSGRITAHLGGLGLDVLGIDLSPAMIDVARREHPGIDFRVGSMTELDLPDASMAERLAAAGFTVEARMTLTSAESALGALVVARREA